MYFTIYEPSGKEYIEILHKLRGEEDEKRFLYNNRGIGEIKIILILIVLIGIVIIFAPMIEKAWEEFIAMVFWLNTHL